MEHNRPSGREKHVTNNSTGVHKRGDGLGTGPVGSSNGYSGRTGSNHSGSSGNSSNPRPSSGPSKAALGGGISLPVIIIAVVVLLLGKGKLGGLLGGLTGSASMDDSTTVYEDNDYESESSSSGAGLGSLFSGLLGGSEESGYSSSSGSNSYSATSYSKVDTSVASGSRAKRTKIVGNGNDQVTLMVYMCGTDLESQHGMASSDLGEMANAKFGDKVNIIVYTGGCKRWKTSGISNSNNQIYQVVQGGIKKLVDSDGSKVMTDPATLSGFIKWAAKNYPADRYELILWDHGGGSISGYGYDEKYASKGSMNLAGINKALKAGGVQFDFIGFDACLMATAETALMLNNHADYMIASEETEPGIGWYYTNWLTQLGKNTSTSTLDLGKTIVDDFVAKCNQQCAGQKTTLSVIDLAEFANTVPDSLTSFSKALSSKIKNKDYKSVSDARYNTREFATSSKIDQIDLVDLCKKLNSSESLALAKSIQGAVKYNKTSSSMTNAYGVSIYFPYKRASYVDSVCDTYEQIGMDDDYAAAIKQFASLEVSGQVAAGGSSAASGSLFGSLLGSLGGGSYSSSSASGNADVIGDLLSSFLGGGSGIISGLSGRNIDFMSDNALSLNDTANYISKNHFDSSYLEWEKEGGKYVLGMPEDQWDLIHGADLNMFVDDGEGYIDMGLDNILDWTDDGKLIAPDDRTWLAINGQPVAYYHEYTSEMGNEYTHSGRVPAMLNGERVNLWIVFDNKNPRGYIAGAQTDYQEKATLTAAKSLVKLNEGDKLEFLCDYYTYSGKYSDSYYLGDPMTVTSNMQISNVDVGSNVKVTYRFTDIYNQEYWTPSLEF